VEHGLVEMPKLDAVGRMTHDCWYSHVALNVSKAIGSKHISGISPVEFVKHGPFVGDWMPK